MTNQYNDALRQHLPQKGIAFREITRLEQAQTPVSASGVRAALEAKDFEKLKELVPDTTYNYLKTHNY